MDIEYYKCVRYYVECITTKKTIEIDELLKLINNCPQLYVEAFTTKIYNLNYSKNLPETILEHKSFTTLSIGICYFLAKSNWMHADVLIKPLISMLNAKIFPHQCLNSPHVAITKETMTVNRMIWTNFSTITATLCSYASTLPTSDPDFELIMKTVVFFWARIAKFSINIFNVYHINADSTQNTADNKSVNTKPANSFWAWYVMALSYTSIGTFLPLNSDDLSEFILNPENYHNFLHRSKPLIFDIPDMVIKGIYDLLSDKFLDSLNDEQFNIRPNPFTQPKKTSVKMVFISSISFLINRTGLIGLQKDKLDTSIQPKISNTKKMMEILQGQLQNHQCSHTTTVLLTSLRDIVKFEEFHLDSHSREYSSCLIDNTTLLVSLTDELNVSVIEELCDLYFKMFHSNLPKNWPIPTDEIYSRLAYLHGIKSIVKKYPQYIGRLRILQNIMELLEHHSEILVKIGGRTYSTIFQNVYNSMSAFTHDFYKNEQLIAGIPSLTAFYFYYNQKFLGLILETLAIVLERREEDNSETVFQTITSVSHALFDYSSLFTTHDEATKASYTVRAMISVQTLSFIASRFSYINGVFDSVISIIHQCFMRPISIMDRHIVNQMTHIMLSKQSASSYSSVMDSFKKLIISTACDTSFEASESEPLLEYPCMAIIYILEIVAANLQAFALKFRFMQDMLEIYIQLCFAFRKTSKTSIKTNYLSIFINFVIKALSCVMQRIGRIVDMTSQTQQLFKNFWVCLVVMGSVNIAQNSSDMLEYYKKISTYSPPLVVDHLRSDLRYNTSIEDNSLDPGDLSVTKNLLIDCLECKNQSEISNIIIRLPALHIVFLTAIFEQESLAVEKDTSRFPHLFLYLEDSALEKDKQNIVTLVEFTCDKIFNKFVNKLLIRPSGYELDNDLIKHITLLFVKFNSERKRVQRASDKYLSILMNKFPHMLWNSAVIRTMLDLMHVLKLTSFQMQFGCISITIDVPHSDLKYTLPDTIEKRDEIISDYQSRCESLINEAARCAPTVICSILLDYLVENRLSFKSANTHHGIELLISSIISCDIVSNKNEMEDGQLNDTPVTAERSYATPSKNVVNKEKTSETRLRNTDSRGFVSTCTYIATSRSHFLGKIDGILSDKNFETENDRKYYPQFEAQILKRFSEKSNMSQLEFSDFFMLSTSYICVTKRFVRKIIYQLCNLPVIDFSVDYIKLAIESWEWIFTSCKYHQISLLSAICSAWDSTRYKNVGIFDFHPQPNSDTKTRIANSQVHDLWITFLLDRFNIVKFYSPPQVKIIAQTIGQNLKIILNAKLCKDYFKINSIPFFRLIVFGLKLLQKKYLSNIFCRIELREKILKSIFLYFSFDFLWPDINTTKNLLEILCTVTKLLSNDRKWHNIDNFETSSSTQDLFQSNINQSFNNIDRLDAKSTNFTSGTLVLRRSRNALKKTNSRAAIDAQSSNTLPISSFTVSDSRSYNTLGCLSLTIDDMATLRSGLIQICAREIERLAVWLNPLNPNENFTKFGKNLKTSFVDKKYKRKMKLFWQINSISALLLSKRFPDVPVIYNDMCSAVLSHPGHVLFDDRAVEFFWSSDQNLSLLPEYMKPLILLWPRGSVSRALQFLTPHLHTTNILTTQYAISCFKNSPIDIVLFHIPQLVQSLRTDFWSYVHDYVLWISQRNNIISHQFIWNMETNAYLDEDSTTLDSVIGSLLLKMTDQIKNNYDQSASDFHKREFTFFDSVTRISGILKPYDKESRKEICQKELRKIICEFGVYLPTNPDSLILNIDYTSGIPMQSAAKAPFLARFEVFACNTETVEKINTGEMLITDMISTSPKNVSMKGAIFKVGDDVRQDVLALQIISLFKDVFQKVELSLYLYPYKVVATSPGCGVIECVKNAKSRDQLGKQTDVSLDVYFTQTYGNENTYAYKKARENFTNSLAAYSVVSYILQVKDRHNGNIMIDNEGHIIHIDFGFLFESSPGGNMGFEPDMKITGEMLNILGGSVESSYFRSFIQQAIKGYLAIRPYQDDIVNMVALMLDTNFPCFRGETIKRLRTRFSPNMAEKEASQFFQKVIQDSCLNLRTKFYDYIQKRQNEIPC